MATFQVNPGYDSASEVEAFGYDQVGDYFNFYDDQGTVVATLLQKNVYEIRRAPETN